MGSRPSKNFLHSLTLGCPPNKGIFSPARERARGRGREREREGGEREKERERRGGEREKEREGGEREI